MRHFAQLFSRLDSTTNTNARIGALQEYFDTAEDRDKLWTVGLFTSRRPRRSVSTTDLKVWAAEAAGIESWLFDEAYTSVGDLAETISLVVSDDGMTQGQRSLADWITDIKNQKGKEPEEIKAFILDAWGQLGQQECLLFNKLITGGFRVGVAQKSIVKALAKHLDQSESQIAHRLMGTWTPDSTTWTELLLEIDESDVTKPYPFYLAYALDQAPAELGPISDWQIEYKWDGIRTQLILREGQVSLWTRGEELVTPSYPEFEVVSDSETLDFVIDGELVVYTDDGVQPFQLLQKRLGRKAPSKKMQASHPCAIIAYDLLEYDGRDLREEPLSDRRALLEQLVDQLSTTSPIHLSTIIAPESWDDAITLRKSAREHRSEGLMLKRKSSTYKVGRKKGDWWKWKVDPYTVDAVMLYAQRGHGRRASLYTDYTFAVWREDGSLVPFAKAYTGLTDAEFTEVTRFVNKNTIEKFGPVRSVTPELVFEIAFEGIAESTRHKSGIALRFPRIKRWRRDKKAVEANTLADLRVLLDQQH